MKFTTRRLVATAGLGVLLAAGGAGFAGAASSDVDSQFSHVIRIFIPLQEKIDPEFSHVEATPAKEASALEILKKAEEAAGHKIASARVQEDGTFHISLASTFDYDTDQAVIDAVMEEAKKAGFERFTMLAAPVYVEAPVAAPTKDASAALEVLKKAEQAADHNIAFIDVQDDGVFHISLADTFNYDTDQAVIDEVMAVAKEAGFEEFTMVAAPVYADEAPELDPATLAGEAVKA